MNYFKTANYRMTLEQVKQSYTEIANKSNIQYTRLKKNIFQTGTLRLATVIVCLFGIYLCWENNRAIVGIILSGIIVFSALVIFHNKLFKKRLYAEIRKKDAENELRGIDYDFSAFDGAAEYINAEHSFSLDLDIFGDRSFFQSLNRTVTSFGKAQLADTLLNPLTGKQEIISYQSAVQELAGKQEFIRNFRTVGQLSAPEKLNLKDFSSLFSDKPEFYGKKAWIVAAWLIPALYVIWIILYILGYIPGLSFGWLFFPMLVFSSLFMKKAQKQLGFFENKNSNLEKYADLFSLLEKEEFHSPLLQEAQEKLKLTGASMSIQKLKAYQDNLQMSLVFPVFLILNPILLWNVRYISKIEKWTLYNREKLQIWFEIAGKFDAWFSMAIYAYNHPEYVFPRISENFIFEGKALGHPMIPRDICVRNDVCITKKPYFLVVTGANMAGKSTYLRTIGINHTLACMGMPVWADSMTFCPGVLVTNLRTADSLADNESYFFAELKRLKMIIDRLQAEEELFIILDEILKGTNSEDKQKGSLALMRQLIGLKGAGVIATHDLLLGKLEKEYPGQVKNYCFEADIKGEHLHFSYKISEGVAQNMNACFLMKKMGITGLE